MQDYVFTLSDGSRAIYREEVSAFDLDEALDLPEAAIMSMRQVARWRIAVLRDDTGRAVWTHDRVIPKKD
jgi:hypothetical protein